MGFNESYYCTWLDNDKKRIRSLVCEVVLSRIGYLTWLLINK